MSRGIKWYSPHYFGEGGEFKVYSNKKAGDHEKLHENRPL